MLQAPIQWHFWMEQGTPQPLLVDSDGAFGYLFRVSMPHPYLDVALRVDGLQERQSLSSAEMPIEP